MGGAGEVLWRIGMEGLKARFRGVFAFPITPFHPDNWMEIDEEGFRRNIRFLLDSGVRAVAPAGGTGEIYSLTPDEHKRVMEICVEEAEGRALVAPGVPPSTKLAVELARHAESVGAEAVLAFPPKASEAGVYLHYKYVSDAVNIGLWVYNVYGWRPEFVAELTRIGKVVAVKDESGDLKTFLKMVRLVGNRLAWICGIDHVNMDAPYWFMAGMEGFTCGIINFAPRFELEIYEAALKKDYGRVVELQRILAPLAELRARAGSVSVVKEAMNMLGLAGGSHRPPQTPLTESQRRELKGILEGLGLNV